MGEEHVCVPVMEEHTLTCPFARLFQEASGQSSSSLGNGGLNFVRLRVAKAM